MPVCTALPAQILDKLHSSAARSNWTPFCQSTKSAYAFLLLSSLIYFMKISHIQLVAAYPALPSWQASGPFLAGRIPTGSLLTALGVLGLGVGSAACSDPRPALNAASGKLLCIALSAGCKEPGTAGSSGLTPGIVGPLQLCGGGFR